jgi:hypothetical protein
VLLARLSAFTGAWTLAASEAAGVVDGYLDPVHTLAALVAQSLVRRLAVAPKVYRATDHRSDRVFEPHDLVLPEMVVEEYLAHYRHEVEVEVKKARDAIDNQRRLYPSWRGQAPPFGSVDEMAEEDRRNQLGQIFRTHRHRATL